MKHTILTNPTEAELAAAVHENLYALFRTMQILPGSEVIESDRIGCHHAPLANAMFRGAWRTRLPEDEVDAVIDETLAWFDERNAPAFYWWTDSQTQPANLGERLLARGFDGNPTGEPGMAADLNALNLDVQLPPGLAIRRVVDQKMLADWCDVFSAAYRMPPAEGRAWYDATIQAGLAAAPWKLYVGHLGSKPVATSILFTGAGVAGLYAIGTLPSERGSGIGAAITLKPLADARQEGYRFTVLFASHMGYPVYLRLGFWELASRIGVFMREKE